MKPPAALAVPAGPAPGAPLTPAGVEAAPSLRSEPRSPLDLTRDAAPATGVWGSACPVAHVRVLLALGNALVIYLDPGLPISSRWDILGATYGIVVAILAYSLWAWRQESGRPPNPALPRITAWLDVLCSA